jgi:ubiquinone/menaquinone biosynthesis C-methylase UbiE
MGIFGKVELWPRLRGVFPLRNRRLRVSAQQAYKLWSETYDSEPENAVMQLEARVFGALLSGVTLADRVVVDIGCGTGRHWGRLLDGRPRALHGVDSSPEMLAKLRARHPGALVHVRAGARLAPFGDATVDTVLSSLMLGYVDDLEGELREWARVLKPGGEVVVTDLHPQALLSGVKRTFTRGRATFEIESCVHPLEALRSRFDSLHLEVAASEERALDPASVGAFELGDRAEVFRAALGRPLVFGFRLRKAG